MELKKPDPQSYDSIRESSEASVKEDANAKQQLDDDVERTSELPDNVADPEEDSAEMPGYKGQVRVTGSGVSSRQSSAAGAKRVDKASTGTNGATSGKGPAPPVAPKTKASVGRVTSHTEATKEESSRKPAQNAMEKKQNKSPTTKDQPSVLAKPTDKSKIPKKAAPEVLPKPNKTPSTSMSPDASVSSPLQTRETAQAERSKSSSGNSATKPQSPSSPPAKSQIESPVKEELEPGKARKPSKKEKDLKCINADEKTEQPGSLEEAEEMRDGVKPKIQPQTPTDKTPKSKPGKMTVSKSSKVNKTEIDNKPHTPSETEQPEISSTKDKATNETQTIGQKSPKKPKAEASPTGSRLPRPTPPSALKQLSEDEFDFGEVESLKQPSLLDARPENDDSSAVNGPLNPADHDQASGNAVVKASPGSKALPHLKTPSKLKSRKEVEKVKAEPAADSQTTVQVSDHKTDKAEEEKPSVETTEIIRDRETSARLSEENKDTASVTQVKDQSVKLEKEIQSVSVKISESTADTKTPPQAPKQEQDKAQDVTLKTTEHSVDVKTPPETSTNRAEADSKTTAQISKKKNVKPEPSVDDKTEEHKAGLKLTQEAERKTDMAEAEPRVDNKTREHKTDLKLSQEAERKPGKTKEKGKEEVTAATEDQEVQNTELKTSSESKAEEAENMQSVHKTKDERTQKEKIDTAEDLPKAEVKAVENKADLKTQPKESKQKANKGEELRRTSDLTPRQTSEQEVDKANKRQGGGIKSEEGSMDLNAPHHVSDPMSSDKEKLKAEGNDSQITKPLDIGAPQIKPGLISKETLPDADKEKLAPEIVGEMPIKPTASISEETEDLKAGNILQSKAAEVTQDASKSEGKGRKNMVINGVAVQTMSKTTEEAGHKETGVPVSAQHHKYEPKDIQSSCTEVAATAHDALKSPESVKEDVQSKPVSKTELEHFQNGNLRPDPKHAKTAEQPNGTEKVTSHIEKMTDLKQISTTNQKPDTKKSQNSPKSEKFPSNKSSPKMTAQDFLLVSKNRSRNESPSSWLDVDQGFEKKQVKTERKMDCSASDENLMDTSDDSEDFIRKIKKLCAPFSFPPKRHGQSRMISPPFAMPAIKEDHFEKTFDPEEFTFGMRRTTAKKDLSPAMLMKKKAEDVRNKQPPKRKGTEDSLIFKALSFRRGQEKTDEDKTTENKEKDEDKGIAESSGKMSSRIERMSILSNLKPKRTQTQPEAVSNGATSPTASQQAPTPGDKNSVTTSDVSLPGKTEGSSADPVIHPGLTTDTPKSPLTPPSLPNFCEIKLTDYLEKYLKIDKESSTSDSSQKPDMPSPLPAVQTEVSSGVPEANEGLKKIPEPSAPVFPPKPPEQQTKLPSPPFTQVSRKFLFRLCLDLVMSTFK